MILNTILKIILWVLKILFSSVLMLFPSFDTLTIIDYYGRFLNIVSSGWRFVYFIFGPTTSFFVNIIVMFFTLKYLVLPVVSAFRSVFLRGD